MLDRLHEIEERYERLATELSDPEVVRDQARFQELAKAHSDLTPLVETIRRLRSLREELEESRVLLRDPDTDVRALAEEEVARLEGEVPEVERRLQLMLLPSDPNDERDVIIEIRAGTGGDEAAIFAADLLRMYLRYAERLGWKTEIMSSSESGPKGFKEVVLAVRGRGAYSHFRYESGPHRVQRVPETESQGRIHTSAATVAVLPEAEEVEVEIGPDDLQVDTYRSSSAGGQNVQKNETAIRILHKPTGIVVTCQDERSQFQNKEKAMRMLRAHLYERMLREREAAEAASRKSQVGSGDRSEKIRTYNFPQNRVTDHRIGLTIHRLDGMLNGEIDDMVRALRMADEAARLAEATAGAAG